MNRPKVVVFSTASADGRLALTRDILALYGDERFQVFETGSGAFDRLKEHLKPQATLEGSGSFVRDNDEPAPLPSVEGDPAPLYDDFLPAEVLDRPGREGWFTAVDGRGRIRWMFTGEPGKQYPGMEAWHALVLAGRHTPPEYLAYLRRENVPYLVGGDGSVDLALALHKMRAALGVTCLLSTAGGRLNGALLKAGLVDEIHIEICPAIIGGYDTPALYDSPPLQPGEWPVRLRLIAAQVFTQGSVWLRYEVRREAD